ncbi:MAG TPA: hypothetical protein VJ979_06605 [Actinomycetota bacterium]|nr:hypothetical protein [Actinomycetota bacterium]
MSPARPVDSAVPDLLAAAPTAALRGALAAFVVAASGQAPPFLVDLVGGGLAVVTQLRVGWLYTMAGHAVSITATGSGGSVAGLGGVFDLRLGLLTIAALGVAMLVTGARATARRVHDAGARRPLAGAAIALPYAALIGAANAAVDLRLRADGGFLPATTSVAAPVGEGFLLPGALALVAGTLGGWSTSASWRRPIALGVRAGLRAFAWSIALSLIGLLAFAALRPAGLERYVDEVTSGGRARAALYLGHQALTLPDQAMWVLAPSMGGCVSLRIDAAAHDVICLDRLPRGPDPATWLLTELGRVEGSPNTGASPAVMWLFLAVPVVAIWLGFRGPGGAMPPSAGEALARGAVGGAVFATLVTITSMAGSLWMSLGGGDELRTVAIGPDPISTAVLALVWGLGGGAAVSVLGSLRGRVSRRA